MIVGKKLLIPIFLILLSGCSKPPPDAPTVPLLLSIDAFIHSDEDPGGISDLFFSFRKLAGADDLISSLSKGDKLKLTGLPSTPHDNTLVYMSGVNEITVNRDFYITGNRKRDLFYSLEGQTWFDMQNHKREGITNIDYSHPIISEYNRPDGELHIYLQWVAGYSSLAEPVNMEEKPLIVLGRGTSFYSKSDKLNSIDITKVFLKIPGGTKLNFFIFFSGNLLKSRIVKGEHHLEILEDFYIYTSNRSDLRLGISRDGVSWNFNPFDFKYNMSEILTTPGSERMEYHRDMEILYR